jgi:hypothetical protein
MPSETDVRLHGMDDVLFLTVKAIGLAGISAFAHTPSLTREARKRYVAAIQGVNNAIVFPESAKKDSTLTAIMLLSQIEVIECFTPRLPLVGWENHVKGAAAVLKLRGAEQLKTPLEVRLFVQAVSALIVCCMKNRIHLPSHLFELTGIAADYTDTDSPGWRSFNAQMLVTQFAAEVNQNLIPDPRDVIQRALDLDDLVSLMFSDAGPQWTFETIYDDTRPDLVLHGYYYLYPNFLAAQVWNGMRSMRLSLHAAIRNTLLKGFVRRPPVFCTPKYTAQFQASTDLLYQMQAELLASIPQYFLFKPEAKTAPFKFPWSNFNSGVYNSSRSGKDVSTMVPLIRINGGYMLPWLLYRTANICITRQDTLDHILGLLRLVSSEMGMRMALVLAEDLQVRYSASLGN